MQQRSSSANAATEASRGIGASRGNAASATQMAAHAHAGARSSSGWRRWGPGNIGRRHSASSSMDGHSCRSSSALAGAAGHRLQRCAGCCCPCSCQQQHVEAAGRAGSWTGPSKVPAAPLPGRAVVLHTWGAGRHAWHTPGCASGWDAVCVRVSAEAPGEGGVSGGVAGRACPPVRAASASGTRWGPDCTATIVYLLSLGACQGGRVYGAAACGLGYVAGAQSLACHLYLFRNGVWLGEANAIMAGAVLCRIGDQLAVGGGTLSAGVWCVPAQPSLFEGGHGWWLEAGGRRPCCPHYLSGCLKAACSTGMHANACVHPAGTSSSLSHCSHACLQH